MAKNEDGEFELILGNKQLLGMFFVVVVLLGVFFIMGYVVGRNSAPLANGEPTTARKTDTKPLVVDSPAPKQASAPQTGTATPDTSKPAEVAIAKAPETKPELPRTEAPKPEPAKTEPIKPSTSRSEPAVPKREAAKAEKSIPSKQANPTQSTPGQGPVAGQTYLQLVATTKHDADGTVEVLRKNGFPALDTEVPEKPGLFRVLVGPLAPGEMNKMKADLQAKGLPGNNAIPKKY